MYILQFFTRKKIKILSLTLICLIALFILGAFHHPFEQNFYTDFQYPYNGDIEDLVYKLKNNQSTHTPFVNNYNFYYYKSCDTKCRDLSDLRLVYVVKSAPQNFERRLAIRSSWGFQKRFSDVEIRTVFLIGLERNAKLQVSINEESQRYNDIIQANYTDAYFNNTYKTMSGFEWAVKYCQNAKFYMFVDDDYYVSTKNVLRFLRFPTNYPSYLKEPLGNIRNFIRQRQTLQDIDLELDDGVRLYTGYVFQSSPLRHLFSKWYVSLKEYPYHKWPPYVSGGAYIVSNMALKDMYYASFYTKHFRFDDIYVGMLAYKTKIVPLHTEDIYYFKKGYTRLNYQYVVASHGYNNPKELITVWNEQKSLGNA